MKRLQNQVTVWIVFAATILMLGRIEAACPFCAALSGTISDEITESKVTVIGRCVSFEKAKSEKELHLARFDLIETLKGKEFVVATKNVPVASIDPVESGETYLLVAFDCEPLEYGFPLRLSKMAQDYLRGIQALPEKGRDRLKYFLNYISKEEKVVSDDAFNEFARATYAEVAELKSDLVRDQVLLILRDDKTSLALRRLYWTFLALCGTPDDSQVFHELLARSKKDPMFPLGLEAAISCYISLRGQEGLDEIRKTLIEDPKSDGSTIHSAILAIRVQGYEIKALKQERLAEALRPILRRDDFADQVIPDLARWEDWSVLQELVSLFKTVDEDRIYIRVPILQYLMACPLPEAKNALNDLSSIDPDAMRRAKVLFR